MHKLTKNVMLSILLTTISFKSVYSINCYQCSGTDSDNPFECNEFLESDTDIAANDCESIHAAQYCIKHVGRYEGETIDCYQCNSSSTMECGDGLMSLDGGALLATNCDHVYDARFCIKQIGGVSTKRFCSSLDLGNYCNYVQQPGDKLEYRTCIYTCNTDGCNSAGDLRTSTALVTSILLIFKCLIF